MHFDTKLGPFWVDDFRTPAETRVGFEDISFVRMVGQDPEYMWSLDKEEVLYEAAHDVGGSVSLIVPGGWRLEPTTALEAFIEAVKARAAAKTPTNRNVTR